MQIEINIMELNHLQTFVIVAEEKSITGAAKRLFTTPSSISVHIKHLEDELGVTLFVRTPRGMQITDKGKLLLDKALLTLDSVRDLVNHATEMQTNLMGDIAVGINAPINFLRIPQLINTLYEDCPGISLQLVHQPSGLVLEQVNKGELALGFVYGEVDDVRLNAHRLQSVALSLALPKQWVDKVDADDWHQLATLPWIYSDYYCPFQKLIDDQFDTLGLQHARTVMTNDDSSKAELVASGIGLSLLEATEAQDLARRGLINIAKDGEFTCDLSVVYLRYRQFDPLIETVVQHIQQVWR